MNLLRKTPGVLDALNCLSKREGVGQHLGPRGVSIFGTARLDNERSRHVGRPGGKVNRNTKSPACDQRCGVGGAHRIYIEAGDGGGGGRGALKRALMAR